MSLIATPCRNPALFLARLAALVCLSAFVCSPALAKERVACRLIVDVETGKTLFKDGGSCAERFSPASTFKLALALMGFESGELRSPGSPAIRYDPEINARFKSWRQTTTPVYWMQNSVLWYSQRLTERLGLAELQRYVDLLDYGNRNLSGDPGKNNGLTHAWLGSSLKISPLEQSWFLRRILLQEYPLTPETYAKFERTTPEYTTGPHKIELHGKTGTAWTSYAAGSAPKTQNGWFVGWAASGSARYVFVHLLVELPRDRGIGGLQARQAVLDWLPDEIAQIETSAKTGD